MYVLNKITLFLVFRERRQRGTAYGGLVQQPQKYIPKLFGELRLRYANRPGGYTRVLRIEPAKEDQAPSAILELVDGPKDMRFAMTARVLANFRSQGKELNDITKKNVAKVTRYRDDGEEKLELLARRLEKLDVNVEPVQKQVYPDAAKRLKPKKARWTAN
jgi:hypothetical protein